MFFKPDGTPFTPGNVSSTGGTVLQKPDFTAADGISTSVGGFLSFFGTSAAAPHAAAIAALLKSSKPSLTPANIRTILASTALDIEGTGFDRDSGSGILDAFAAVQATGIADPLGIVATPLAASGPPGGPFSGASATYQLTNNSANPLDWSATKTQGWVDLSPAGGTLAPGASTVVTLSVNATANALSLGVYSDSVTVMDVTSGLTPYFPPALCQITVQTPQTRRPVVVTNPATTIRATSATLNAAVNPLGSNTTAYIEYGLDTSYGSSAPVAPQPGNGNVAQNVALAVTGLVDQTPYHFRVVATNGFGTTAGNDQSFTTASQPPVLTVTASSLAYLENQAATAIDPLLTATNPIGPNLTGASVAITGNFAAAEDVLGFVNQNNISGAYDSTAGVLTLTGTSAVANYQVALRSVTYANLSDTPSALTRTVTFSVNDGALGATGARDITVTPVNDAPTLTAIPDPPIVLEDAPLQTVALAGISAGGGETQALTVTAKSSNPALIPDPVVAYTSPNDTGSLSFTPVANASGTAVITVQVQDDGGTANGGVDTTVRTFTVRVMPVNDAPSFLKGANVTAAEDAGPQAIIRWATGLKAGPPDESGQALNFLVTVDKPALFSGAPAINSAGTLTFTSAPNANGVAMVTVRLHDNGGTANGGVDTSPPQTFTLTIQPSNDSPTFVKGADQVVTQTAGPQTVSPWATAMRAGPPDESGQLMDFLVTTDTPALFLTAPAIAPDGTLTFQPDPAAHGVATVTVRLHDDGGVSPGVDTSPPQTFSITTTLVNAGAELHGRPGPRGGAGCRARKRCRDGRKTSRPARRTRRDRRSPSRSTWTIASLFTVVPSVAADGTLTFTPSPTGSGTATVTVRLHDDGGLANGGADTSAPQTFHLAVSTYAEELGAYNGLAVAAGGAPPSHERTGLIKVNVVKTGAFTGSLVLAGHRYTLAGQVDKAGTMTFGHTKAAALDLKRTRREHAFARAVSGCLRRHRSTARRDQRWRCALLHDRSRSRRVHRRGQTGRAAGPCAGGIARPLHGALRREDAGGTRVGRERLSAGRRRRHADRLHRRRGHAGRHAGGRRQSQLRQRALEDEHVARLRRAGERAGGARGAGACWRSPRPQRRRWARSAMVQARLESRAVSGRLVLRHPTRSARIQIPGAGRAARPERLPELGARATPPIFKPSWPTETCRLPASSTRSTSAPPTASPSCRPPRTN